MSNFFDDAVWIVSLFKPDRKKGDTASNLAVKDTQRKLNEEQQSPQKILTADDFFSEIMKSKEEHYNKTRWSEETLIKKVQSALEEAAAQGSNYIMIECDNYDISKANLKPVKDYLNSLGFNTSNLEANCISGSFDYYWYIKGYLRKCRN